MDDNDYGECLNCGKSEQLRRGLCSADYQRFQRQQRKLTRAAAIEYEQCLIDAKKLLPNRQGRKPSVVNDDLANAFEAFLADNPNALAKTIINPAEVDAKVSKATKKTKRKT